MTGRPRPEIPRSIQVEVFFRDRWLCHLCHRPTVFDLAFKFLSEMVDSELPGVLVAMYDLHRRRDKAPLLDEIGACLDHVESYVGGGAHDISNFATACARCNARKSDHTKDQYLEISRPWKVRGQHGEPEHWDGLASLFVILARHSNRPLTGAEKGWLRAFEEHYAQRGVR
ncbi:MAG: HNH endonuclease [Candidatus Eisenbacteria bacterium]